MKELDAVSSDTNKEPQLPDSKKYVSQYGRPLRFINPDYIHVKKIERNKPCPCGSGQKAKKCHLGPVTD